MKKTLKNSKSVDLEKHTIDFRDIRDTLINFTKQIWLSESYFDIRNGLIELDAKNKEIQYKDAVSCWNNNPPIFKDDLSENIKRKIIEHYIRSVIYSSNVKYYEADKKINLLTRSAYHLGALSWQIELSLSTKNQSSRAKFAAKEKSKKLDPIRTAISDLLQHPPSPGWKSARQAAEILEPAIEKIITEKELGKIVSDSFEFIYREISTNVNINEIFKLNKKPAARARFKS